MTFIPVECPLVGLGPLTLQVRPLEILILPPNTFTIFLLCVTHKSHPKATHVSSGHLPGQIGLSSVPGSGLVLQRQRPPWEAHVRVWWRTRKQHIHYCEACRFCGDPGGGGVGKASRGDLEQGLVRSPAGRKGILGESTANAKTRRQGSVSCPGKRSKRRASSACSWAQGSSVWLGKVGAREHQCLGYFLRASGVRGTLRLQCKHNFCDYCRGTYRHTTLVWGATM